MVNRVKKGMRHIALIKSAGRQLLGKDLSRSISGAAVGQVNAAASPNPIPGYKNGSNGKLKKNQLAYVHKNEVILSAAQVKAIKKLLK
jgi:hypothetical protein